MKRQRSAAANTKPANIKRRKSETKVADKKRKLAKDAVQHSYESEPPYIQEYEELKQQFQKQGISQTCILMIRRITYNIRLQRDQRDKPVLILITEVASEQFMTQMELSLWSIYLNKRVFTQPILNLYEILNISALASKKFLNDSVEPIHSYLNLKIPNFSEKFTHWTNFNRKYLEVHPKEIHAAFKELIAPLHDDQDSRFVDYNTYVDEILLHAQPYNTHKAEHFKDLIADQDVLTLLAARKNKAEFYVKPDIAGNIQQVPENETQNDFERLEPPTLAKLDSVLGQYEDFAAFERMRLGQNSTAYYVSPQFLEKVDSFPNLEFMQSNSANFLSARPSLFAPFHPNPQVVTK